MSKYIIIDGLNKFESNSRNAKKHLQNTTENEVVVVTKNGKFISRAIRYCDDIVVSTIPTNDDVRREREWCL